MAVTEKETCVKRRKVPLSVSRNESRYMPSSGGRKNVTGEEVSEGEGEEIIKRTPDETKTSFQGKSCRKGDAR